MKFVIFALMVVFALVCQTLAIDEQCTGENEKWNGCGSRCGEMSCTEKLANVEPRICPAVCQPGCYCAPNFIRVGKNSRGISERTCMPIAMCH